MRVRKFRPEDAPACSRIIIRNFRTVISKENPKQTTDFLISGNSPKALLAKSRKRKYFVAADKGRILGIGGYALDGAHTFFVDTRLHGKGTGKAIMVRVLRDARKDGIKTLKVNSSLYAEKFYASCGFRRLRKITVPFHESTITVIVMKKSL
ncbi:GNAT family N-acetyltransferase [Candidatus Woesearchaeota archaeon]|nr:GNAT family N-acetyltransferase [Candidatus Woesearchaeota archaeon]